MKYADWQPTADGAALSARARILDSARAFFKERGVLEVETPLLCAAASTDPRLASVKVDTAEGARYLQTSPEYAMKRLLAAGSGDIFQICKAFRAGERGRLHNPEFTMLEWYRVGMDLADLMAEVADLLAQLLAPQFRFSTGPAFITYREVFTDHTGIDPLCADETMLVDLLMSHGVSPPAGDPDRDELLDLALASVVLPALPRRVLTFIHAYPANQAALARLDPVDDRVALRFEAVLGGSEICNGFEELCDADEQLARFEGDRSRRVAAGLPDVMPDARLLDALRAGLPRCSGVAVGLDRVLLLRLGREHIDEALAFPVERA